MELGERQFRILNFELRIFRARNAGKARKAIASFGWAPFLAFLACLACLAFCPCLPLTNLFYYLLCQIHGAGEGRGHRIEYMDAVFFLVHEKIQD